MAKVYIKTYGCSHNFSDSEHMAGILAEKGHNIINNEDKADLVIINTCTVKTPTEHTFFGQLSRLKKKKKKLIIAGCIPQTDPEKIKRVSLIGTHQIDKIAKVVEETLKGKTLSSLNIKDKPKLSTPTVRTNSIIEIIPINTGCLGKCTYCKTKAARGHLNSHSIKEIITKARDALNNKANEIWLTSQDTACYGLDIKTNIAELLKEVTRINKNFKIRLGMGNPNHILKIKKELIEAMKNEKVYKFLHIPLQSGNNKVLRAMKRDYTVKQYKEIVSEFKKEIPEITIATDIICGFPGETKKEFEDSIKLLKETKPDVVNVSRYWSRSKTPASKLPNQIPDKEIMKRSEKLSSIARKISLENKKKNICWQGEVLINEKGKQDNQWKARTPSYKQVLLKGKYKLGQKVKVNITESTIHDLIGKEIKR